jgi:hypothetical protein
MAVLVLAPLESVLVVPIPSLAGADVGSVGAVTSEAAVVESLEEQAVVAIRAATAKLKNVRFIRMGFRSGLDKKGRAQ